MGNKKAPLHKCAGALLFFSAHHAGNEDLQTDADEDDAAEDRGFAGELVPNFLPMARPASQIKKVTAATMREQTFNYTCHNLLPEALEVWPSKLIGELLPRHLEIIEKIQDQFAAELKAKGVDEATIKDMAIYTGDSVRMAYLATYGGSHVNGVAELHSQLLKDVTLKNFSDV